MRIVFTDLTAGHDWRAPGAINRGIETATTNLAEALARRGHDVSVVLAETAPAEDNGVLWLPQDRLSRLSADVVVVNNNPRCFGALAPLVNAGAAPVLWLHNPVRLVKWLQRGDLYAAFRFRPAAVFVGDAQAKRCQPLPLFRLRTVIGHGVAPLFLQMPPSQSPPPQRAIYTSAPYRGLADMARLWRDRIAPKLKDAQFHVFAAPSTAATALRPLGHIPGLVLREPLPPAELADELRRARVMIYPGHRDETYCLAAAEAIAMGTPLVTRGIGALRERVADGEDGFIVQSDDGFAEKVIALLTDDTLWLKLHDRALAQRPSLSWAAVAARWEALFDTLRRPA